MLYFSPIDEVLAKVHVIDDDTIALKQVFTQSRVF